MGCPFCNTEFCKAVDVHNIYKCGTVWGMCPGATPIQSVNCAARGLDKSTPTVYDEGTDAFVNGVSENPYGSDNVAALCWQEGYYVNQLTIGSLR